ncbi:MAG: DsrE family protein [Archaeoglobus sp.]|nr:DsrE family protein [Archaeoglobus sp.]
MVGKIFIAATNGPDNPEKAILPFRVANTAFVADPEEVVVMLLDAGVLLARKGVAEHVVYGNWNLKELIKNFLDAGGELLICSPCLEVRGIDESELIDGAVITGGTEFILRAVDAEVVSVF